MMQRTGYFVLAIKPCWRYAVALRDRPDLAAIPYYSKASALAEMDSIRADLPDSPVVLLRKRFFRRVEEL